MFFMVIYNTVFSLKSLTSIGCVLLSEGLTAKTRDRCGHWSVQHSARKPSAAYAESGRRFLECKQPPCLIFTENGPKRCLLEGLRLYLDSEIQTVLLCMISAPFSTTSSVSVISLFFLPLLLSSLSFFSTREYEENVLKLHLSLLADTKTKFRAPLPSFN